MAQPRPQEVVLIRHAESLRNKVMGDAIFLPNDAARDALRDEAQTLLYDQSIPLTANGFEHALNAGPAFIEAFGVPDCIFHSGYVRASMTRQALLMSLPEATRDGIAIFQKLEIRERDVGYIWHMIESEIKIAFPWLTETHARMPKLLFRPPGGESFADLLCGRLHSFMGTLVRDRPGKKIWCICHGNTMRAFQLLMERTPINEIDTVLRAPVPHLAVTRYVYAEGSDEPTRTHLNHVFAPAAK